MEKKLEDKLKSAPEVSWHIKEQVLEALVEAQTSYLLNIYESQKSDKESYPFLQVTIDHLVRLSKSEYGFIGEFYCKLVLDSDIFVPGCGMGDSW